MLPESVSLSGIWCLASHLVHDESRSQDPVRWKRNPAWGIQHTQRRHTVPESSEDIWHGCAAALLPGCVDHALQILVGHLRRGLEHHVGPEEAHAQLPDAVRLLPHCPDRHCMTGGSTPGLPVRLTVMRSAGVGNKCHFKDACHESPAPVVATRWQLSEHNLRTSCWILRPMLVLRARGRRAWGSSPLSCCR